MSRRGGWQVLLVAFIISLVVNHGTLLPTAYFLFSHLHGSDKAPPKEEPAIDIEIGPPPAEDAPLAAPEDKDRVELPRPKPTPPEKKKELAEQKQPQKKPEPPAPKKPEEKKAEAKPEPQLPQPVKPLEVQRQRLKMVEAHNAESDKPPDDALFLSDKNRRVKENTRARETNLLEDHPKPRPSALPGQKPDKTPGAEKPRIAETREQQARPGSRGREGREGREGKGREKVSPLMSMRSPIAPREARQQRPELAERGAGGDLLPGQRGQAGVAGRKGRGLRLDLDYKSQDRIDGQAGVKQRELARLQPSATKGGGVAKKWERIRSALENFVPEVKPGNQTALGTRADPFALYIARMHRKIHKLWGFGFLVDLDGKPDSNPMNNMSLWTMIEIVVAPSGVIEKATIARPSGLLTFDVAALDTVFSSGPYEATPRAIRSADGKVYVHWRFHRDQRQCGTFGVDPFILTTPPKGPIDNPATEVADARGRTLRRLHAPGGHAHGDDGHGHGHSHGSQGQGGGPAGPTLGDDETAAQPAARAPSGKVKGPAQPAPKPLDARDPAALAAARRFVQAFSAGSAQAMVAACDVPFSSGGRKVASSHSDLQRMLGDLLAEAGGRGASPLQVLTPMQARAASGQLPEGVSYEDRCLLAQVKLGRTPVTLILGERGGRWRVTGLNR